MFLSNYHVSYLLHKVVFVLLSYTNLESNQFLLRMVLYNYFTAKLVSGSSNEVQHPRIKTVFIRAIQDQHEIQLLYEESQARRGDEIAYELCREVDWSSKMATRGLETSYNGKFSSDGRIRDVDYSWAKSVRKAKLNKYVPQYFGSRNDGGLVNEENIDFESPCRMDTGTGIAFIPMVQWPGHPWAWQGCSCKI